MNHDELQRLFKIEYQNVAEFFARCAIIGGAAIVLFGYTGWAASLYWIAGYAVMHIAYFSYLFLAVRNRAPRSRIIATTLLVMLMVSFAWMPIYLLQIQDPALNIPATAAILAFMLFMISRAEKQYDIIAVQVLIVATAAMFIAWRAINQVDELVIKLVVVASEIGVVGYFLQSLLQARKNRLQAEASVKASIETQKMEAIGRLAGGVAHDFNNLLTVILGNLELHDLSPDSRDKAETLEAARLAAERARGTVQQLLTYARRADYSARKADLREIADYCIRLGRPLVTTSINLEKEIPHSELPVLVDKSHLTTAILNLIINAKDAMGDSGTISVIADRLDLKTITEAADGATAGPGTFARVTVRDTGPGIPDEIRARILEPFFTTKEIGKGTGLGLSMVSGFVGQSGGFLQVESSPNGAAFSIALPMIDFPTEESAPGNK
ncbi:sensor histidine kinase [Pseudooceanicola sp. HF7]|uniref:sensor histidine kinase n=1 Tax=Pseudooceanicola sp. HF7 TaxID=2721560 RepID=UPI00142F540C|nr:ATP-binding protein [Pseudooceanicola sp. HF7]